MGLRNVARRNTYQAKSDIASERLTTFRRVEDLSLTGYVDAFELCQDRQVRTRQLQTRYDINIPFLVWFGSCKDVV